MQYKDGPAFEIKPPEDLIKSKKLEELEDGHFDADYVNELVQLFEGTEPDRFHFATEVLCRTIAGNSENILLLLSETNFFEHVAEIFEQIPSFNILFDALNVMNCLFQYTANSKNFDEVVPQPFLESFHLFFDSSKEISVISNGLTCFTKLLECKDSTDTLFDMSFFGAAMVLDETILPQAEFQGDHSEYHVVIGKLLNIMRIFFNKTSNEKFADHIPAILERYKYWLVKGEINNAFIVSAEGFSDVAGSNVAAVMPYLKDEEFMDSVYHFLRFNDQSVATYMLNFIYHCSAESPEDINLEKLAINIQPHLMRRGGKIEPYLSSCACNAIGIFLSFPEYQQFLIESGVVGMIIALLDDQSYDVKANATLAISNLLTCCPVEVLIGVVSEYPIVSPMMSLLETEQTDVIIGILQTLVKILEVGNAYEGTIKIAAQKIVDEIDRDRIEELATLEKSATTDLAEKLMEIIG